MLGPAPVTHLSRLTGWLTGHWPDARPAWLPRWPRQCAVCRSWDEASLCPACITRFAAPQVRCPRCALLKADGNPQAPCTACSQEPPPFDLCIAALDYSAPWTELIARFKFRGDVALAEALAQRVVAAVQQSCPGTGQPDLRAGAGLPGLVLPVPIAAARLRERGYNQSWELARRVARELGLHADSSLLLRTGHLPRQVGKDRSERLRNVRHAFAVDPLRRSELHGRRVAVVDDVMTTGATAWELARTLKQAGASAVEIWTLARTA